MRQPGAAVRIWIRIGQAAALAALALSLAACPCPAPVTLDQVFLLDATNGPDAGPAGDASFQPLDCTPAAAGCVPGGACRPACDCIVARDQIRSVASIQSCTLLADSGPAAVEMRYKQEVFCGGD
jgi:hypothetical protein